MHKLQAQVLGSGFGVGGSLSKRASSPFHHRLVAKKPQEKRSVFLNEQKNHSTS